MWDLLQLSFGTASLVALIYAAWPHFTHKEVRFRRQAWYAMVAFFLLTGTLYLWSPGKGAGSSLYQIDTVQVSDRYEKVFEVFYPRPFERAPNLKARFVKGRGTLEFVVQRPDGFNFKVRDVSYITGEGAEVEWVASGIAAK